MGVLGVTELANLLMAQKIMLPAFVFVLVFLDNIHRNFMKPLMPQQEKVNKVIE